MTAWSVRVYFVLVTVLCLAVYMPDFILIRAGLEPLFRSRTECPYLWVLFARGVFRIRNEA